MKKDIFSSYILYGKINIVPPYPHHFVSGLNIFIRLISIMLDDRHTEITCHCCSRDNEMLWDQESFELILRRKS